MSELKGQIGEVRMTVHVTRKATGETETHELVGKVTLPDENVKEKDSGGNALDSGA